MFKFFGIFNQTEQDLQLANQKEKMAQSYEKFAQGDNASESDLETAKTYYKEATELLEKAKARYENFHKVNDLLSQEEFKQMARGLAKAYCSLIEGEKAYLNIDTIEVLKENVEKVLEDFTNEVFKNPTPIDEFEGD